MSRAKRLVVPLSGLTEQLPGIVPWLDRLVPGVWLSPPPPRTAGGLSDLVAESKARADYAPRQALVPWHAAELVRGWGVDVGSRGSLGWAPLDSFSQSELRGTAEAMVEGHPPMRAWLRSPPGEPRLAYQWAALGYAYAGVQAMALHWSPGAGKSRAALEWAIAKASGASSAGATIVICTPSNVVRHWERQVRRWSTLDPITWVAPSLRRKKDVAALAKLGEPRPLGRLPTILLVSHDNIVDAWADDAIKLPQQPEGIVVFDEAHLFRGTKRNQAIPTETGGVRFEERTTVGGERTQANVLREVAEWATTGRIELSGTPIGNRFAQLWVQLDLLDPGGFGSFYCWSARHAFGRPGEYGGWDTFGAQNIEEHRARVSHFFFEVPYSESQAALPPKRRETIYLPVSEQVQELGGWTKIMAKSRAEGRARELEARRMQAASRKRRFVLSDALEAMRAGLKVTIITGRRLDVMKLHEGICAGLGYRDIEAGADYPGAWWASGERSQNERVEACDQYMAWKAIEHDGIGCCLTGTMDSLGIGIDLQDTDLGIVAMLPSCWDELWQIEGRWNRPGMTRSMLIKYVIAEGTYDEHIAQLFLSKLPAISAATPALEIEAVGESLRGLSDEKGLLDRIFAKIAGSGSAGEVEEIATE